MSSYDPGRIQDLFKSAVLLPTEQRQQWLDRECAGDAELRGIVEDLVTGGPEAKTIVETEAGAPTEWLSTSGLMTASPVDNAGFAGPFRLLRELGRGGMGKVYLGERADGQYTKKVAVKVMSERFADGPVAMRFFQERQILARLEHPNIARLLDGGATAEGLPFLAMEYVDGVPIDRYLASSKPSVNETLELFCKICSAVAYAHRNLIVHRDLKPANIMVAADGEPKLLDFGIAKTLDATENLTATGAGAMTPQYASPEQIAGAPINTASDIYSLGVVLYEMLTGARPYRPTSGALDLAQAIVSEPPRSLSACPDKHFDPDLDNIVQMALRKEPTRRYATADQLAEDIRKYRAGYPVIARADTRGYRLKKFVGRNRAWVLAAGLALVALVAGTGAIWREWRIADRRFNDVRKLARAVIFDYHDAIQPLPGSTPVRERMVKDGLEYLDNLAKEADSADLRRELIHAYVRISNVQGSGYQSNLGDTAGARQSAAKAVALADALLKHDQSPGSLQAAAAAYDVLGTLLYQKGDLAGASERYRQTLALNERLKDQVPDAIPIYVALSQILQHLGDLSGGVGVSNLGKTDEALKYYQRAIDLDREFVQRAPKARESRRQLFSALNGLGTVELAMGKGDLAQQHFREALGIIQQLSAENPDNSTDVMEIAGTCLRIGHQLAGSGDAAGALPYFERAEKTIQPQVDLDPKNTLYRRNLAVIEAHFISALRAIGKPQEALVHARRSLELGQSLLAVDPQSAEAQSDVAIAHRRLAETLFDLGDRAGALNEANQSVASLEKLSARGDAYMSTYLALSTAALAKIQAASNPQAAIATYRRAMALQSKLSTADPSNSILRSDLAKSQMRLADLLVPAGEAQNLCGSAIANWNRLKEAGPLKGDDASGFAHCSHMHGILAKQ